MKKWLNDFCRALTPSYSFRTLYILSSRQVSTRFIFIVLPTKQKGEKKLQVCHETWKEHTRTSSSIALSCGLTFFFGRFEEQLDPIVSILYIRKQSYETEWLIVVKQFEIECIQERLSFSICSFENIHTTRYTNFLREFSTDSFPFPLQVIFYLDLKVSIKYLNNRDIYH